MQDGGHLKHPLKFFVILLLAVAAPLPTLWNLTVIEHQWVPIAEGASTGHVFYWPCNKTFRSSLVKDIVRVKVPQYRSQGFEPLHP